MRRIYSSGGWIFIGFLHVEMASQECAGMMLSGTGWECFYRLTFSLCTRHAHKLTLAWLYALRNQAYLEYCQEGYGPHEPTDI